MAEFHLAASVSRLLLLHHDSVEQKGTIVKVISNTCVTIESSDVWLEVWDIGYSVLY